MKRILSLILVLVMILGVMPVALADGEGEGTPTPVTINVTTDKSEYMVGEAGTITVSAPAGYTIKADSIAWPAWGGTAEGYSYSFSSAALNGDSNTWSYTITCTLVRVSDGVEVPGTVTGSHKVYAEPTAVTITGGTVVKKTAPLQLTATVEPTGAKQTVSWSATGDISVSNTGLVTTNAETGSGVVTATVDGEIKDTHDVTIAGSEYRIVLGSTAAIKMYPGQAGVTVPTATVQHKVDGTWTAVEGANVTWSSSSASITVASGTIAASAAGTATLTASATVGGETVTANVSVSAVKPVITCANTSAVVGGTATLVPTITNDYTKAITVTYSYTGTSAANSASLTSTAAGVKSVEITATVDGSTTVADKKTVKVSFYRDNQSVEVDMVSTVNVLDFDETSDITVRNQTVASLLCATSHSSTARIHFTNLSTTGGKITLYTNISSDYSTLYTNLGNAYFTPNAAGPGYFTTSYIWRDPSDENLIYGKGVLTINYDENLKAITYKTNATTNVTLEENDFYKFWYDAGMSGYPEYVVFEEQPVLGDLYATSALKTRVSKLERYYYNASSTENDLDAVTYKPMNLASTYKDEIPFTMYGDDADEVVYGMVVVEVGQKNPFIDVKSTDYFYDAVLWAVDNGITTGQTATTFAPNAACTRAQVVTFLWRAANCQEPSTTKNPFTDVKPSDYYYKAVLWAVEKGITTGLTTNTFGPDAACTRAQVVTFLHRAKNLPTASGVNKFTDVSANAYYYDAVRWAVQKGITTGMSGTTFGSNSTCTRAQVVTFLYRYVLAYS